MAHVSGNGIYHLFAYLIPTEILVRKLMKY